MRRRQEGEGSKKKRIEEFEKGITSGGRTTRLQGQGRVRESRRTRKGDGRRAEVQMYKVWMEKERERRRTRVGGGVGIARGRRDRLGKGRREW